jgi:hypothetical protein
MLIPSIYYSSLQKIKSDEPISSDMQGLTIFSRWSSRPCMSILIAYLESPRRIESDEYDIIDMRRDSIFNSGPDHICGFLISLGDCYFWHVYF